MRDELYHCDATPAHSHRAKKGHDHAICVRSGHLPPSASAPNSSPTERKSNSSCELSPVPVGRAHRPTRELCANFITEDRSAGGNLMECAGRGLHVGVQQVRDLRVRLAVMQSYLARKLSSGRVFARPDGFRRAISELTSRRCRSVLTFCTRF